MIAHDMAGRYRLRPITLADAADAYRLSSAVGWPHRAEDWRFVLSVGDGLVATFDDRVVGTVMWWIYEAKVARLGMVIVDPLLQGAGIGTALMTAALSSIDVPTVILNATAVGEPLYRRLGFEVVAEIMQFQGVPSAIPPADAMANNIIRSAEGRDLEAVTALDADAVGVRRGLVIAHLAEHAEVVVLEQCGTVVGFAACRRFGRGYVVGPVVAPDAAQARALFANFIKAKPGAFLRADVAVETGLSNWLEEFGLAAIAPAITMVRGPVPSTSTSVTMFSLVNQALG